MMQFKLTIVPCLAGALLLASFFSPALARATHSQATVKEDESGFYFQVQLSGAELAKGFTQPLGKQAPKFADQQLTGVGIREKTIFAVNVYAMGIYVDSKGAGKQLSKWRGKSAKQLQKDKGFYEALLAGGLPTSLRLVMCRDVDGDDMAEAFEDSLAPRMKTRLAGDPKLGSMDDLKRFRAFFAIDEVKDEVELIFTWDTDGTLYTRMQGLPLGAIHSPALCQSLFDIYLGQKPITKAGKRSLVKRVPGILAASQATATDESKPADKK